jgi:FKBP-type peptidyl-prolyl cis-trans isomerase
MQFRMLMKRASVTATATAAVAVLGLAASVSACGKKAEPAASETPNAGASSEAAAEKSAKTTVIPFQKFDKNDRRAVDDYLASKQGRDFSGGVTQLKTEEVSVGQGPAVKKGDTVTVQAASSLLTTGRKLNKTAPNAPLVFKVGDGTKIAGLEEGVIGMKAGGKRKLTIPPDKAHGKTGQRVTVPGNATVVYEVELIRVEP